MREVREQTEDRGQITHVHVMRGAHIIYYILYICTLSHPFRFIIGVRILRIIAYMLSICCNIIQLSIRFRILQLHVCTYTVVLYAQIAYNNSTKM